MVVREGRNYLAEDVSLLLHAGHHPLDRCLEVLQNNVWGQVPGQSVQIKWCKVRQVK